MINLLPQEEKIKLKLEQARNLTVILSGMVLISLVCLVLILLSLKFSILSDVRYQKSVLNQAEEEYQSAYSADLKDIIKKYNSTMPQVLYFYQKEIYFSDILESISKIPRSQGLYFSSISLDGQKYKDKIAVSILGKSDTRASLLSFKKNLESQSQIKSISFSQESWINPENINFNVTFDFLTNGN